MKASSIAIKKNSTGTNELKWVLLSQSHLVLEKILSILKNRLIACDETGNDRISMLCEVVFVTEHDAM